MHDNVKLHLFMISIAACAFERHEKLRIILLDLRFKLEQALKIFSRNVNNFDESYVCERYVNTLKWQQTRKNKT